MRTYTEVHEKIQDVENSGWNQDNWNISGEVMKAGVKMALIDVLSRDIEKERIHRALEDRDSYEDQFNLIHDLGYVDGILWYQKKDSLQEQTERGSIAVPEKEQPTVNVPDSKELSE